MPGQCRLFACIPRDRADQLVGNVAKAAVIHDLVSFRLTSLAAFLDSRHKTKIVIDLHVFIKRDSLRQIADPLANVQGVSKQL